MQLCYRGNTYSPNCNRFTQVDSVITARFMGNPYTIYRSRTNLPTELTLYQYRGISYTKTNTL